MQNPLVKHAVEFSLMVIKYVELLEANRKFVIANQVLKSATAIGANIMEAQSAESKADFIHKLKIADKEAYETMYWFYLCEQSEQYCFDRSLSVKLDEVMRLLNAIILSAKRNNN
ncbi:four helix bundle protein [Nemorincola caseinilytica]